MNATSVGPAEHREPAASQTSAASKLRRPATDDEILGLAVITPVPAGDDGESDSASGSANPRSAGGDQSNDEQADPSEMNDVFAAKPELRRAWQDAQAYREAFATPEEAKAASVAVADLSRMDALFFSGRPEDHAQLAQMISKLAPEDFVSLAREMGSLARAIQAAKPDASNAASRSDAAQSKAHDASQQRVQRPSAESDVAAKNAADATQLAAAQEQFFHSANAATVQSVIDAIETQVERLLPEGVSKATKGRLVGEIYREVDNSLRSNRQLAQQLRASFQSGSLDAAHQKAVISLVTARARQALPGIAKRVLNEWSSAVLATHQESRAKQRSSERRIDIVGSSGSANDGRRPMTPRDINYARMSDSDILNL